MSAYLLGDPVEYRVWPDGTVQLAEDGEPHRWMSDDYSTVLAHSEEEAIEMVLG